MVNSTSLSPVQSVAQAVAEVEAVVELVVAAVRQQLQAEPLRFPLEIRVLRAVVLVAADAALLHRQVRNPRQRDC